MPHPLGTDLLKIEGQCCILSFPSVPEHMWNLNTVSVCPRLTSLRVGWDSLPSWASVILATRMQALICYHPVASSPLWQVPHVHFGLVPWTWDHAWLAFFSKGVHWRFISITFVSSKYVVIELSCRMGGEKCRRTTEMFLGNEAMRAFRLGVRLTSNSLEREEEEGTCWENMRKISPEYPRNEILLCLALTSSCRSPVEASLGSNLGIWKSRPELVNGVEICDFCERFWLFPHKSRYNCKSFLQCFTCKSNCFAGLSHTLLASLLYDLHLQTASTSVDKGLSNSSFS